MSNSFYQLNPKVLEAVAVLSAKVTTKARLAQKPAELSEKGQAVQDLLTKTNSFGCQTENVRNLCSILLEEEIPGPASKLPVLNSVVVLVTDKDGTGFKAGTLSFVYYVDDTYAYLSNIEEKSRSGRNITSSRGSSWRYANDKELVKFFENFSADHLINLLQNYDIGKQAGVRN